MPSKQAIIDNIEEYTAVQLVDYIKDGIVTFEELCEETEGYFSASVRKEVKQLLAGSEEDEWLKASTSNSKEVLLTYLQTYPESIHREEAREMISALEEEAQFAGSESEWDAIDKEDIAALKQFCLNHPSDDPRVIEARKLINQLQKEAFLGFDIDSLKEKVNGILTDSTVINKDAKIFETIKESLKKKCDEDIQELATSSFHSIFGNNAQDFHWGSNSESCLGRGIAQMYEYALTKDNKYRQAALSTLDYFFGRNATGYCYLTGFGTQRVMNIHHRISAADNIKEPVPGLVAGGANKGQEDAEFVPAYASNIPDESYQDNVGSYASNEIAINWNAYLVSLLGWIN